MLTEINDRFRIDFRYESPNGEITVKDLVATEFFECDDFDSPEWSCDLPWRNLTLREYVPASVSDIRSITLTITDVASGRERTIHVQFIGSTQLTLSWSDRNTHPGHLEVILDVPTGVSLETSIARLGVDDGVVKLTSHALVLGDDITFLYPKD